MPFTDLAIQMRSNRCYSAASGDVINETKEAIHFIWYFITLALGNIGVRGAMNGLSRVLLLLYIIHRLCENVPKPFPRR